MTECNKRDEITEHTEASKHTHTHTASLLCSTTEGQRSEVRDVVNSDVSNSRINLMLRVCVSSWLDVFTGSGFFFSRSRIYFQA